MQRWDPWMALSFTEGSIGGDIERIDLKQLAAFYSGGQAELASGPASQPRRRAAEWVLNKAQRDAEGAWLRREPTGSNGIAIAPALTAGGRALLLINPHTSLFFRSEQQVSSDEGLNAYGAATWGQFFIYQGFNPHAGWMHTSSGVDSVDEFAETVARRQGRLEYRYAGRWFPVTRREISLRFRLPGGGMSERRFVTLATRHGPLVRMDGGRPIAFAMMNRPVEALQQSFLRTKATDLASFLKVAELRANSSNNTIFADDRGEIAYLHPQFVPRRDNRFDYTRPVDGSRVETDWHGLHPLAELPSAITPPNGWVVNTNTAPWRTAGPFSPQAARFPRYMDQVGTNYREAHAIGLLQGSRGWTLDTLQRAAFDPFQPGFAAILPSLLQAWDALPAGDPRRSALAGPVRLLRGWDYRWSAKSEAESLANFWAAAMLGAMPKTNEPRARTIERIPAGTSADAKLAALQAAVTKLIADFGGWRVPWGEINRYQRPPALGRPFDDRLPSLPLPFASGNFGSLASIGASGPQGTKRWYGEAGNSFVAVVEFGPRVRARAAKAGGESGDFTSPHFDDQAQRYADGNLRPVYYWPDELRGHVERMYRPGE
ncbi:penicillin acylase family protein [Sphingomonas ginkgonis]|uniref:penicillin acylase family protein n=1 Tax=Sphingomonas ginkgonis TaxID=2315330 RepID=UPI0030B800C5